MSIMLKPTSAAELEQRVRRYYAEFSDGAEVAEVVPKVRKIDAQMRRSIEPVLARPNP